MWKDEIKKERSDEQQLRMEALDFATGILDRIEQEFGRSRINLPKDRLLEFRQTLRELFLEAAGLE
tara:strand:+ start:1263 stop:1460 length:198 start_codon:yes stop_codon:yes gene_type:complete